MKNFLHYKPIYDKDTMEHWLSENKLYAYKASHFVTEIEVGMICHSMNSLKMSGENLIDNVKLIK